MEAYDPWTVGFNCAKKRKITAIECRRENRNEKNAHRDERDTSNPADCVVEQQTRALGSAGP
jgi:hypothetical protein